MHPAAVCAQEQKQSWIPWSYSCLRGWGQFYRLALPSALMMMEWIASEVCPCPSAILTLDPWQAQPRCA